MNKEIYQEPAIEEVESILIVQGDRKSTRLNSSHAT